MRLIDADALLDYLQIIPIDLGYREVDDIEKYVKEAPTADVAERKKGKWIFNPTDAIEMMFTKPKCSECGFESADGGNFCPNCGADMRGNNNE